MFIALLCTLYLALALFHVDAYRTSLLLYRMPPRKKPATPKGRGTGRGTSTRGRGTAPRGRGAGRGAPTARQQAAAKARETRATRAARQAEVQESVQEVDQGYGVDADDLSAGVQDRVDQAVPGVAPAATPRPVTIDDLLLVITQMQQQQAPPPPPPSQPPQFYRGPAADITEFVKL